MRTVEVVGSVFRNTTGGFSGCCAAVAPTETLRLICIPGMLVSEVVIGLTLCVFLYDTS